MRRVLCSALVWVCGCAEPDAPIQTPAAVAAVTPIGGAAAAPSPTAAGPIEHTESPARPECVATRTIEATLRPANLLFLIDRSGSMNCNLPPLTSSEACEATPQRADESQPSKWVIVRDALQRALAQLPPGSSAGINYLSNDDRCGVQSKPHVAVQALDSAQFEALRASLNAVQPRGGTPIVGGLILAFKQLNPYQTPGQLFGNRFVVLLTDGEEGCAPDQIERLLVQELPKARRAGIATFVVGVPGSEINRAVLSRAAFAGGAPSRPDCAHDAGDPRSGDCHFDMTRDNDLAAGLARALDAITRQVSRCEFDLPQADNGGALDYARVNVVYTEQPGGAERVIGQDAARPCAAGADGWQYNADKSRIVVCGPACERVRRATSVRIALGCESIVLL